MEASGKFSDTVQAVDVRDVAPIVVERPSFRDQATMQNCNTLRSLLLL